MAMKMDIRSFFGGKRKSQQVSENAVDNGEERKIIEIASQKCDDETVASNTDDLQLLIAVEPIKPKRQKTNDVLASPAVQKMYFDGMKIAVSGIFQNRTREAVENFILENGGKISAAVSGRTHFLVVGTGLEDGRLVSEGSKYRTAVEKNVKILTEEDFFKLYPVIDRKTVTPLLKSSSIVNGNGKLPVTDNRLWVEKYRPRESGDLIGHHEIVKKISDWLMKWFLIHIKKTMKASYSKENPGARAALLSGPPGIGKTTLATMIAKQLNFDILELNASDTRNKRELDGILIEAVSSRAISGNSFLEVQNNNSCNRLVIMDEVDGMGGSDRGGIAELIKIIKVSRIPIICICNDRQSVKVRSLANHCYDLKLKRPTKNQIANRLVTIASQENLHVELNAAEMLVEQSGNDIRQALNALQMWSGGGAVQSMTYGEAKSGLARIEKDKILRLSPFDACSNILGGSKASWDDRYNFFFIDYSLVPLLVQQNYIDSAKSGLFRNPQLSELQKMEALSNASHAVSDMDMIDSVLRGQDQHWELLPTQAVFSMNAGFCVQGFQPFPSFPMWLGKNSTKGKRSRLINELVDHTSLSIGQGFTPMRLDYIPYLRSKFLHPLIAFGKDAIQSTVESLDHYGITKDDLMENIREMQFLSENGFKDEYDGIDSQLKTALTKYYNSQVHNLPAVSQSFSSATSKKQKSSVEEEEEGELLGEEEVNDIDDERDVDELEFIRAQMNKTKKGSKANSKVATKSKSIDGGTTVKAKKGKK